MKDFRLKFAAVVGCMVVFLMLMGWAGAVDYTEQVILHMSQEEYDNVVFHAQAIGVADGEQGYVVTGKPLVGRGGRSGHVGPLAKGFALSMSLDDAAWRVNGMRELVARYLANVICGLAPDAIYVWCDLLPDMDELREELLKTLPADSIPELMGVADYDGCVLTGELALCLRRLAQQK